MQARMAPSASFQLEKLSAVSSLPPNKTGQPFFREIFGLHSGRKKGTIILPSFPGEVLPSAAENCPQLYPYRFRTLSLANDPLIKHCRDIEPPKGFPNRCPHPSGSASTESEIAAKNVSDVPRDITIFPG